MLIDYHIHTKYCHGVGGTQEYITQAIKLGFSEIGFAEHFHYRHFPKDALPTIKGKVVEGTQYKDFIRYYQEVSRLREKYKKQISIKVGAEVDFLPETQQGLKKYLDEFEFDFIIGSVHFVGSPLKYFTDWSNTDYVFQSYNDLNLQIVKSGLFDILAHPELTLVFYQKPFQTYKHLVGPLIEALKTQKMVVEINTDYLRSKNILVPSIDFLKLCKRKDIGITLGSDAHKPWNVGAKFQEAMSLLKEIGFTHLVTFEQRRKKKVKIS